jgi:hypothetical protein
LLDLDTREQLEELIRPLLVAELAAEAHDLPMHNPSAFKVNLSCLISIRYDQFFVLNTCLKQKQISSFSK